MRQFFMGIYGNKIYKSNVVEANSHIKCNMNCYGLHGYDLVSLKTFFGYVFSKSHLAVLTSFAGAHCNEFRNIMTITFMTAVCDSQ